MLEKVISGGQIGADIAGLRAAKKAGFETGGWAPRFWETRNGPQPLLLKSFGLEECMIAGYPARTKLNVLNSDATIRFAANWNTGGERCTLKWLNYYDKPYLDITITRGVSNEHFIDPGLTKAYDFLMDFNVKVLNIAGNGVKWIEDPVEQFLYAIFEFGIKL